MDGWMDELQEQVTRDVGMMSRAQWCGLGYCALYILAHQPLYTTQGRNTTLHAISHHAHISYYLSMAPFLYLFNPLYIELYINGFFCIHLKGIQDKHET